MSVGQHNGHVLGLIVDRRITRDELNRRVKSGEWSELHRGLIAEALKENGLL